MILLVLLGKMIFLFPEHLILHLRRKMKDDLSQKNTRKYNIFFKLSEIWSFQKGPPRHIIFFVLSGKMVFFFPENMIFFPWAESERRSFSENTWKYEIFCVHVRVLQTWHHAPLPKKSKMVLSRRNTPKGDWRSRLTSWEKAPAIFCTFMETFAGVLMHCSPAKKNRELNI